ncbi:MAG TPA: ABC transporter permease [Acidimicrobiia bacterium]
MSIEQGLRARLIRTLGFLKKELFSVFRQPRLILTLVIGPFLILLIFGLGYRTVPPPFETELVLNEEARLADETDLNEAFGNSITFEGTTTDLEGARERLRNGEIDLLIVAPDDPLGSLQSGEKADFQVIHGEVDPVVRSSIELLARLSVDEINRRVLSGVVTSAQDESEDVDEPLTALEETTSALVAALEEGNRSEADREIEQLRTELSAAERRTANADSLYRSVGESLGFDEEQVFASIDENLDAAGSADQEAALQAARALEESVSRLESSVTRAQELDANLLVSPFGADVVQVNDVTMEPGIYYSPGTIALLVQHLALTFAALSLVRDRELGLTEVFRVSPLASGEALAGKYLGFGSIGVLVATALTGALLAFGVTVRGSWLLYVGVLVLVIIASLGLGFVISGVSKTDSQAVQYSMMILLISIFFTGFVLPLDQLAAPVRVVSYLIPATYGIQALQDLVFRGVAVDPMIIGGLAVYALALMAGAWFVVRRDVVSVRR